MRRAAFVVLLAVAFALGFRPLADLDLGWHLAGGLTLMKEGAVPWVDPFTEGGHPWINYSWLPELLFAAVYRLGGFELLQVLQLLLIVASLFAVYSAAVERSSSDGESAAVGALFAMLLALPMLVPFWHLRPQLLSVVLLAGVVGRLERDRLSFFAAILVTAVWAACHVYWVFMPGLWLLYKLQPLSLHQTRRVIVEVFALFVAGALSPYGVSNFAPVFEYALSHQAAYLLIDEFRSILGAGFEEIVFGLALVFSSVFWGSRRGDERLKLLLVLFAAATVAQRKYLPLFAVIWAILAAARFAEKLTVKRADSAQRHIPLVAALLFLFSVICFQPRTAALDRRFAELIEVMDSVPVRAVLTTHPAPRTFNHFDDGGWLAFVSVERGPHFQTSIDGRTLVAGAVRLAEFHRLLTGDSATKCEVFERWGGTIGVVPRGSAAFARVFGPTPLSCVSAKHWQVLSATDAYEIWGPVK